ncbi:MAG: SsrA-binding protein [Patescibacteria group bacterium]|jgi:SsrA-binding protein|nr:SsrA-binding protein [Patescibacteria group bacterium]
MKIIAKNRRAYHDYEIIERFTAGISLQGHEVKSIRAGQISLKGSFVHFQNHEAYLVNAHIRRYSHAANLKEHDPTRSRKLLLHRKQIDHLEAEKRGAGLAVIPIAVGLEHGLIKVEIGLGRGKKHYDKREASRKKTMKIDAALEVKRRLNT